MCPPSSWGVCEFWDSSSSNLSRRVIFQAWVVETWSFLRLIKGKAKFTITHSARAHARTLTRKSMCFQFAPCFSNSWWRLCYVAPRTLKRKSTEGRDLLNQQEHLKNIYHLFTEKYVLHKTFFLNASSGKRLGETPHLCGGGEGVGDTFYSIKDIYI